MTFYSDFHREVYQRQLAGLQRFGLAVIADVDPDEEPITLPLAYAHCRIDTLNGTPPNATSDDDVWLTTIGIPAARELCEVEMGRSFAPRTLELATNAFPSVAVSTPPGAYFPLPFGPVQSIESVKYLDEAIAQEAYDAAYQAAYDAEFLISGDPELADAAGIAAGGAAYDLALEVTLDPATYVLDNYQSPSRLILAHGATWPTARSAQGSVKVRYVTGYGPAEATTQVHILPRAALAAMALTLAHLYEHRGDDDVAAVGLPVQARHCLMRVHGSEEITFA